MAGSLGVTRRLFSSSSFSALHDDDDAAKEEERVRWLLQFELTYLPSQPPLVLIGLLTSFSLTLLRLISCLVSHFELVSQLHQSLQTALFVSFITTVSHNLILMSQAQYKKRLKALMNKPENQVCSDCPERQPRWASLIVPPPGSPPGSLPIGAFCCLECSGSHRRLGVHISFVRSINLDSCK